MSETSIALPSKAELLAAHQRIRPYIHKTPVLSSSALNKLAGAELFFKCENFQRMGAFKMRGAMNAILQIPEAQQVRGVATHSSGNFAQAVSLSAKTLGLQAYIVMPDNAPTVKKEAVLGYGAKVTMCPPTQEDREKTACLLCKETGATFVHPSNQREIIIGMGTAAKELIDEQANLDHILVPVGGGGLLAGTALFAHYFSPDTEVIAGEPMGADDAWQSLKAGKIIPSVQPKTIADGLRTSLGDVNFPIIKKLVKEIIRVEEEEIVAAMKLIWQRMKIVIEPSSAVPFAAILKEKDRFKGKKIGIILTGGNVDLENLPF